MTEQIVGALVSIVLALLVPLVAKGFQLVLVRLKLDKNEAIQVAVRSAIAYTEEVAARELKTQGIKVASRVKLETAISKVLEKVPGVTVAEAETLITQELPKVGLGAAGFLQGLATAVQTPAK